MMTTIYSPLEQFEIVGRGLIGIDRPGLTNSGRAMMACAALIRMIHEVALPNPLQSRTGKRVGGGYRVPTALQSAVEGIYGRVGSMVNQTMGHKGEQGYTFVYTLMVFVLGMNRLGLVPYGFTGTSHIAVTLTLALTVWMGKRIRGVRLHGIRLRGILLPAGTPIGLVPLRVPLELLSFRITFISLSVRLFANMMAGHILLKVIGGFAWTMLTNSVSGGRRIGVAMYRMHRLPRGVLLLLMALESGVAFIQAYVFTLLSCIYTADMIEGGH